MLRQWFAVLSLATILLSPLCAERALAQPGPSVVVEGPVDHDLYLAGGTVDVRGQIDGDVIAAGGRVSISDTVADSVLALGGSVEVNGAVHRSVRVAGADLEIAAQVGRDLAAAGGTVTLRREAHVSGRAWLAGAHLAVAGSVDKGLTAAGDDIVISGTIGGDAHLRGRSIKIGPAAVITGHLTYQGEEAAEIDPHARIAGGVTRQEWTAPRRLGTVARVAGYAARVVIALGLFASGVLFVLVFPAYSLSAARLIGGRPVASLGLGFALMIATPAAALIAMATMIGAMLGLAILAVYLVSMLLALLTAVLFVGDVALRAIGRGASAGIGRRLGALALGLIALVALSALPIVGGLILIAAIVWGLGAFYLEAAERY